jgi:DNA helicase II / ATP-dependent DNA helicase PcrA
VWREPFMRSLTDYQRLIVNADIHTSMIIEAGPGSGKTLTMAYRIYRLLKAGVPPSSILILTFTNVAARELKERVRVLYKDRTKTIANENFKTIHSFAFEILNLLSPYQKIFHHFPNCCSNIQFNDMQNQLKLVKSAREQIKLELTRKNRRSMEKPNEPGNIDRYLHDASISDSQHREINESPKTESIQGDGDGGELRSEGNIQMASFIKLRKNQILKRFCEHGRYSKAVSEIYQQNKRYPYEIAVFERYQQLLGQSFKIDYDDAIAYLYVTLKYKKTPAVKEILHRCLKYIVIDECQDLSRLQLELIKLLIGVHDSGNTTQVIAVGDRNQSIYSFRGGLGLQVFEELLRVGADYPVEKYFLKENFRSLQNIVAIANKLFPSSMDMISNVENIPSGIPKSGHVELCEYSQNSVEAGPSNNNNHWLDENESTIKLMKGLNERSNCYWKNMMVLAFKNVQVEEFLTVLERNQIPCRYGGNFNAKDDNQVVVSTIHGAKGMEAENVFVIGCQAPNRQVTEAELSEEERLMYVAITRAKYRCYISSVCSTKQQPSASFQNLQNLLLKIEKEEEEEELEFGYDDDANDNLKRGSTYNIKWIDRETYKVILTRVREDSVDIYWVEEKKETLKYPLNKFLKNIKV